jgi:RNA-directed DNA polymerase
MSKFLSELTWDNINWGDSHNKVRRFQRRIFKASQLGDKKKVWHLQQSLIRSPYAKLVATQRVTTFNKVNNTQVIPTTSRMKMNLAKNLRLNGKASLVKRVWIPKAGKTEKRPLGIPTIQDHAKQSLARLALEPEWEAKFEPNSYGFRPGRSSHDAIEAIFNNLNQKVDKLVYEADIRKCFDRINHKALLAKLESFPLMERQIEAWLQAGRMEEYANISRCNPIGTIISPLLANIAFHGLEKHLLNFISSRDFPKALGLIRYADDFILIHRNPEIMKKVIQETKNWLAKLGLEISEEKSKLRWASQAFKFLGFQIILVTKQNKFRVKITPSKESVNRITLKIRKIIQTNKSSSSYGLISLLRPVIIGWANYYSSCEWKETFKKIDNIVYNQLRAWVLRRAPRKGRYSTMMKYFIAGREYKFQGKTFNANWIFSGSKALREGKPVTIFLPKITWISSTSYRKESGTSSVYDGNHVYWAERNPRYTSLSTRVRRDNLQVLHRECHINKTIKDLGSLKDT